MAAGDVEVDITTPNALAGASFDGVDDNIDTNVNPNFNEKTFEFKVFVNEYTANGRFFNKELSSIAYMSATGEVIYKKYYDTGDFTWTGNAGDITLNAKTKVKISDYGDETAKLFINDIEVTFTKVGAVVGEAISNTTTYILGNRIAKDRAIKGIVSDFKLSSGGELKNYWKLEYNYTDVVTKTAATNDGTILAIYEEDIATTIKAARTTANDIYLIAPTANGLQPVTVVIEEAP